MRTITSQASTISSYRPDIDGLRAISILSVLAYHAYPSVLPGGFVGVDVFFVISGYLIGGHILFDLKEQQFSFFSFYSRRILRIFPALVAVLITVYGLGWLLLFPQELEELGQHITAVSIFSVNFLLLQEVGYFDTEALAKPLLHLWSLAIEEQFYLLWPVVTCIFWRKTWSILPITLLLMAGSFYLSVEVYALPTAFYSPLARFWELLAGTLLAQLQQRHSWHFECPPLVEWFLRNLAGIAGLAIVLVAVFVTPLKQFPGWWAVPPVVGSILILAAGSRALTNKYLLGLRGAVFIGLISYPLYLWHWPLISLAWIIYAQAPPPETNAILIVISFVLAWLTFELVEKPIRFGAQPRTAAMILLSIMMIVGGTGLWTAQNGGLYERPVVGMNHRLAEDLAVPTKTRTSDGSCRKYFGIDMQGEEVCLASSMHPRILILGDSHAMAAYSAIYSGLAHESAVLLATHSHRWGEPACIQTKDFSAWLKGRYRCQDVIRNVLALLGHEPSVQVVVVVSHPFNPFFQNEPMALAFQKDILATGRKLVWMTDVPTFGPPWLCGPRTLPLLGPVFTATAQSCQAPRQQLWNDIESSRRLFEKLKYKQADVFNYNPFPSFCDANTCYQTDDKGVLYWLGGHVNIRGSARLLADFLPWARAHVLQISETRPSQN